MTGATVVVSIAVDYYNELVNFREKNQQTTEKACKITQYAKG